MTPFDYYYAAGLEENESLTSMWKMEKKKKKTKRFVGRLHYFDLASIDKNDDDLVAVAVVDVSILISCAYETAYRQQTTRKTSCSKTIILKAFVFRFR